MDELTKEYQLLCNKKSDINEHLPTLYKYAMESNVILELGVRNCVSTWAFALGLAQNSNEHKKLIVNDIMECDIRNLEKAFLKTNMKLEKYWQNDLTLDLQEKVDLLFIDTWHIYGQLIRELEKFHSLVNKYIILHDTTTYATRPEPARHAIIKHSMKESNITKDEIKKGLKPAVDEFLAKHSEWTVKEIFTNNNGLTILERK